MVRVCLSLRLHAYAAAAAAGAAGIDVLQVCACVLLQVWVPDHSEAGSSALPQLMTNAEFDRLTSTAANMAAVERKKEQPYQPPSW